MKSVYRNNEVCIIGYGCVLPGAETPEQFWDNIINNRSSFQDIPKSRWNTSLYYDEDKSKEDKIYSVKAASISNEVIDKLAANHKVDTEVYNRLHIQTLDAADQALSRLNKKTRKEIENSSSCSVFLGCMSQDESQIHHTIHSEAPPSLKDYIRQSELPEADSQPLLEFIDKETPSKKKSTASLFTTSVTQLIKERYGFNGESALIDAACASSLAAIDVACNFLKTGRSDFAITGGIESNLSPDSFVLFSKAQALSEDKCLPFDKRTGGLIQGEGSVIFILRRLEDAVRADNRIYGIIRNIGSSSDGKVSSLFSPSVQGQVLAYKRAYKNIQLDSLDYIECHGTGTKIGDSTEVAALEEFFGKNKIPIGSVKSLIGHTKGAAGASGLLKAMLTIKNRLVPPSKYIQKPLVNGALYVNSEPVDLKNKKDILRMGVSSFGFGNINFHVILEQWDSGNTLINDNSLSIQETVTVNGYTEINQDKTDEVDTTRFNIPPRALPQIDRLQIQALLAAEEVLKPLLNSFSRVPKENIHVFSAGVLGLEALRHMAMRLGITNTIHDIVDLSASALDILERYGDTFPRITEDSGPGVLNNVISGRVCNTFDLKGRNFHVDADLASSHCAIDIAVNELLIHNNKDNVILLLMSKDRLDEKAVSIKREGISALILSGLPTAKKYNLPIISTIDSIDYRGE